MRRRDVYAAPITYELDGVQYIAASVGGSTRRAITSRPPTARMLVFTVGGDGEAAAECALHGAHAESAAS